MVRATKKRRTVVIILNCILNFKLGTGDHFGGSSSTYTFFCSRNFFHRANSFFTVLPTISKIDKKKILCLLSAWNHIISRPMWSRKAEYIIYSYQGLAKLFFPFQGAKIMTLPIAEFVTPFQQPLRTDVTVLRLVEFISITKRATYLLKYNKTYIPCSTRHSSSRELNFQRWRFLRVDDNKK